MEHTNALWHVDFHDGSRNVLTAQGRWVKPYCLCVIDDRSRLACHIQWYLDVTTKHLVHGFSQALMRRALPRAVMTDNGSAMISEEFTNGLHELGILHQPTLPRTPWANGKQERLWGTLEGRLMAMLEGEEEITLDLLNRTTHAWVEGDYHQNLDSEIGCSPLQRYRAGPDVGRECLPADRVRRAFQIESTRTQRRSDGTISLHGQRFEIPSQFAHLHEVRVRYTLELGPARSDRSPDRRRSYPALSARQDSQRRSVAPRQKARRGPAASMLPEIPMTGGFPVSSWTSI
jgi:putative transposase